MPSVSRAQQKAMFSAAAGHSTLGIPRKVGEDFAHADIERGKKKLPARKAKKHGKEREDTTHDGHGGFGRAPGRGGGGWA